MTTREPSAIDAIAERYTGKLSALDPLTATSIGIKGYDHLMTDLSPDGFTERAEHDRATLRRLDTTTAVDAVDETIVTADSSYRLTRTLIRSGARGAKRR